jgi:hypothetical protein
MGVAMSMIKRFAFWPLSAIACMVLVSSISNPEHGSTTGALIGLSLSMPLAIVIDRRRRRGYRL